MIIFCIPEPKRRIEENSHLLLCIIQAQFSLSLLEPWRCGPRALLPWLWLWAHPSVRGTQALVGVQAMWSPFQESSALPWSWIVLLKPQRDLEQVGKRNQGSFQIPHFKNCGHQAVCTDSLSTQLCGLGTMETSLSLGEKWLEDHYQGQSPGDGCLTLEQLVLGLRKMNMAILCLPPES